MASPKCFPARAAIFANGVRATGFLWGCLALGLAVAAAAEPDKKTTAEPPDLRTRRDGDDWPRFLGPTGDSKSRETGIRIGWPEAGPPLVWQKRVGDGYGMPAISRGRLLQFGGFGNQMRLMCMESETGKELWTFEYTTEYQDLYGYDIGPRCAPLVDGDRVYLFGVEGMLHCLRVIDGSVVWKIDTSEKFGVIQNFFGVGSTPAIEGDLLIVQVGGSPDESKSVPPGQLNRVKTNGTGVVAFDKYTGKVKYELGDELASYASPVLATIDGRRWCFVFARGGLLAFDPTAGTLDFDYPWRASALESVNASNPVVVGDLVFISETYGPGSSLLRVRPGNYEVVWSDKDKRRDKSLQTHWNTPIHHEGFLYGSSGRHAENAELRCIELATGKVMWDVPGLSRSSLLYVDGHFVCLTEQGIVLLFRANSEKFDLVAQTILPTQDAPRLGGGSARLLKAPAWAAPILSHGLLYLRGADRLVCLELIPAPKEKKNDEDGRAKTQRK
ncbi:MAG TPA: PQQ-binding-like beta-propeller repeat protein [Pirellulales bacterium]|nr:PQQ-binding-like beta-propeller repeat protein [Pirellulales bacterium]